MPTYDLTVQRDLTPQSPRRRVRGEEHSQTVMETVTASTLANAARKVALRASRAGETVRIVAAEERSDWSKDSISDDQLNAALTRDCEIYDRLDPDDYDHSRCIYTDGDFHYLAQQIQRCLNSADVVPGLELSLLYDEGGAVEYTMVEIRDYAAQQYRSRGCELKHLTTDRSATGWDGVLAIARALTIEAQPLM